MKIHNFFFLRMNPSLTCEIVKNGDIDRRDDDGVDGRVGEVGGDCAGGEEGQQGGGGGGGARQHKVAMLKIVGKYFVLNNNFCSVNFLFL